MRYVIFILLISILTITCTPPVTRPDYVGTWRGTGIGGVYDITLIADETTYEIDLYSTGNPTLLADSQKGTHGSMSPNTEGQLQQTQRYDGANWVSYTATRAVQYAVSGATMDFKYDDISPHTDPWMIEGQLIKQ